MSFAGRLRKRRSEIAQKNKRRVKIAKLKVKFKSANSDHERKKILEKIWKMSHAYPVADLIAQK